MDLRRVLFLSWYLREEGTPFFGFTFWEAPKSRWTETTVVLNVRFPFGRPSHRERPLPTSGLDLWLSRTTPTSLPTETLWRPWQASETPSTSRGPVRSSDSSPSDGKHFGFSAPSTQGRNPFNWPTPLLSVLLIYEDDTRNEGLTVFRNIKILVKEESLLLYKFSLHCQKCTYVSKDFCCRNVDSKHFLHKQSNVHWFNHSSVDWSLFLHLLSKVTL